MDPFKRWVVFLLVWVGGGVFALAAAGPGVPEAGGRWPGREGKISPVPVRHVRLEGGFWAPKMRVYQERTVPHSWRYMGHNLRSLRKAAGEETEGPFNGTWDEANLYKLLETIAHSLGMFPDAALERRVDEIVDLIGRAQRTNGYAHVFIINEGKPEWDPTFLDGSHDGYVLGHMIEAAIEYHANTGKRAFLDLACKAADEACEHFLGPKGVPGFCGHAELEMALVELARATGRTRYVELARAFVEWRGRGLVKPAGPTPRSYFQDQVPLRQQRSLDGHAVRSTFFATGVADLALATGDPDYRLAANRFWDSVTRRRMTITGSTGPRQEHEAFGEDYELPNHGYYESCAACGLMDFAQRMFLLEGEAESGDVLERVLYNAVLHGISLDGTNSYYQNPLSDTNRSRYNSWVCCPPNLSRTLFQVGRYAYASGHRDAFLNLFVAGTVQLPMEGGSVGLTIKTEYPWEGRVNITVDPGNVSRFAIHLRWPGWCEAATVSINGSSVHPIPKTDRGYIRLERDWRANDVIEFVMEMPVQRIEAHPMIQACAGQVALQRGPLVYGFEGVDNDGKAAVELGALPQFRIEARADLLGGVRVVTGNDAEGKRIVAIPFYAMANRAKSVQEVWIAARGWKASDAWWEGRLYRSVNAATPKSVALSPTEEDARLSADFSVRTGAIRPLHGINKGPLAPGGIFDVLKEQKELGIPFTRLHDCGWPNPYVVDHHAVFPHPNADPARPESYDFRLTDEYIDAVRKTGAEPIYRLGESIEHTKVKRYVHPPADMEQWVAVCLGIVRHYNEGWAGGFHHNIRYWEIWNEPENRPAMWSGTDDDYLRLYRTAALAIKQQFPALKVGGPALGASGSFVEGEFMPTDFVTRFLTMCRQDRVPLDFFSWHCYTADPAELTARSRAIRRLLDSKGFTETENHLNEWNFLPGHTWSPITPSGTPTARQRFYEDMAGAPGAAFVAASLLELQDAPIDVCNFYHGELGGFGLFTEQGVPRKAYQALRAFQGLVETPRRVEIRGAVAGKLAFAAGLSTDGREATLLVSNFADPRSDFVLNWKGLAWTGGSTAEVRIVDATRDLSTARTESMAGENASMRLTLQAPAIALIRLRPNAGAEAKPTQPIRSPATR